jgi:phage baseplate assembly protein W
VQDIKRAVKHIVLLNPGEKPFHPEIGTGVRQSLFENFTPPVRETLRGKIEFSLQKYEPRVTVTSVVFEDTSDFKNMDNNTLVVQINFYLNNIPQQIESVEVMLERLR